MNPAYYPILKALHIVSMTAWMAGMFYLPRLLSYHAGVKVGSAESNIFKTMERRLLKVIIVPAMIATWVFGISLVIVTGYGSPQHPAQWLMAKVALVVVMTGLHGFLSASVRKFSHDANTKSSRFYKIINELITIIFVAIVFLVVLKPF